MKHILNSKANHQLPGLRMKVLIILIALALWVPLSTSQLFAGSDEIGVPQVKTSSEGEIEAQTANQNVVKLTFQTKDYQKISLLGPVNDFPLGWPEQTKTHQVTSPFGNTLDPILKQERFHNGIDIKCPLGTHIIATAAGKVITAEFRGGYGNMIIINHVNLTTIYAKLADFKVKPGDMVKKGDLIAYSGNTGRSTGPHLHYEIHYNSEPVNPERFCYFQTKNAGQEN